MLQHHFLLSFTKRCGRKQFLFRVNFIQVVTGDRGFIYHLTSRCFQCWNETKRILLKEPVRFVFKVNVDGFIPAVQKCMQPNEISDMDQFNNGDKDVVQYGIT